MRYAVSALGAVVVGLLLFLLDHKLISSPPRYDKDALRTQSVEFIRVTQEDPIRFKERRLPKKPTEPERPPPPSKVRVQVPQDAPQLPVEIETPAIATAGVAGTGPYLGSYWVGPRGGPGAEGEVVPIVRIQPRYPRQALLQGLEGWVHLEFTILKDGTVSSVNVLDADPRRVFDRAAVQAVLRWKFKPRIIDGEAVERRASQIIEFELDEEVSAGL